MTMDDGSVEWFQPYKRALFSLEGMRVSRSMAKVLRRGTFDVTFDTAFEDVMRGCLRPTDNWISEDFIQVYGEVHRQGWGHSVEVWHEGTLAGGLYGIALGSCFCAESMFHRKTNASKVALSSMIDKCREMGFTIFDAQVMNPHLHSLGAFEITHRQYMELLEEALKNETPWSRAAPGRRDKG